MNIKHGITHDGSPLGAEWDNLTIRVWGQDEPRWQRVLNRLYQFWHRLG